MERIFICEIFSRMANKNKKSRCLYSLIDGISGAGSYLWSCHFPGFYDHPQFSSPEAVLLLVITKNRYLSVKTFGKVQFSERAQSNCFIFSANQICQRSVNRRLFQCCSTCSKNWFEPEVVFLSAVQKEQGLWRWEWYYHQMDSNNRTNIHVLYSQVF